MGKKIYVGNLSYSLNDQSLMDVFSEFGSVQSARIIMDRDSGRSKGFAFVEMATDDEAATAISRLNGFQLAGRAMNVSEAKPMMPREGGRGPRDHRDHREHRGGDQNRMRG
ncbi:MAG: RNA-binding protein [Bdellovibrionales bacterium]|nr:RNA-binding protein [Bdellovibrionales bacterium]